MDCIGPNGKKWTEWTKQDRMGTWWTEQNKVDQCGPNRTKEDRIRMNNKLGPK